MFWQKQYISDVLPELGEENMQMSTFMNLALKYLGRKYRLKDKYTQMECIVTESSMIDRKAIKEKSNVEYAVKIRQFVDNLKTKGYIFNNIE